MITSNYHIHSTFCDGKDTVADMAKAAYMVGLDSIGFSSHFVMDYPDECGIDFNDMQNYYDEVHRQKERFYPFGLDIFTAFEMDYYMHTRDMTFLSKLIRPHMDYIIGSIHTLGYLDNGQMSIIDADVNSFKNGIEQIYKSPRKMVEAYYDQIGEMAETIRPDIIGHIDLIKINNRGFFDEEADYYKKAVMNAIDRISYTDCIVEVNTGGMFRYGKEFLYPSIFILEQLKKFEIPVTVNGDSHQKEAINYKFDYVERLLKDIGFKSIHYYKNDRWREKGI